MRSQAQGVGLRLILQKRADRSSFGWGRLAGQHNGPSHPSQARDGLVHLWGQGPGSDGRGRRADGQDDRPPRQRLQDNYFAQQGIVQGLDPPLDRPAGEDHQRNQGEFRRWLESQVHERRPDAEQRLELFQQV